MWKEGGWICWPTVQSADYKHQVENGTGASQIQVMNGVTGKAELIIVGDDFFTADEIKLMLARKNDVDLKYASNAWTLIAEDDVQPLPEFKLWNRITFKEAFDNKLLIKSIRMENQGPRRSPMETHRDHWCRRCSKHAVSDFDEQSPRCVSCPHYYS